MNMKNNEQATQQQAIERELTSGHVPRKKSRSGKHKEGYIRPELRTPEGRVKWNERSRIAMVKYRARKKALKPILTLKAALETKGWAYRNYWACFDKPHVRLAWKKGVKGCRLKKWNQKLEPRTIPQILLEDNKNALLILHNKGYNWPAYNDANVGEIDIDCHGYAASFPWTAYVSRAKGSVKFLFLYQKRDMLNQNCQQNWKQGVKCKFDFKVNGHSYLAGSTHAEKGELYDLKRFFRPFFINNNQVFSLASEAYKYAIDTIKRFESRHEQK